MFVHLGTFSLILLTGNIQTTLFRFHDFHLMSVGLFWGAVKCMFLEILELKSIELDPFLLHNTILNGHSLTFWNDFIIFFVSLRP